MSEQRATSSAKQDLSIFGRVVLADKKGSPDSGAVVLLLPAPPQDLSRQDPTYIRPFSFEPLENPTIDWIRAQGGTVVRSNIDGHFEVFGSPGKYNLVIISKATSNSQDSKLTKQQVASLSQYFLPVDQLIERQAFYWQVISLENDTNVADVICK